MKYELKEHQQNAVARMKKSTWVGLWHDPGTGKTLTSIDTLKYFEQRKERTVSVIIVCPNHLVGNWRSEIKKWEGNPAWKIVPYSQVDKHIGNYEVAIIDECHGAKSLSIKKGELVGSQRAKAIYYICQSAKVVWGLSATPYPNSPVEMGGVMTALGQGHYVNPSWKFMRNILKCELEEHYIAGGGGATAQHYGDPQVSPEAFWNWMQSVGWHRADKSKLNLPLKTYGEMHWDIKLSKADLAEQENILSIDDCGQIGQFASYFQKIGVKKAKSSECNSWIDSINDSPEQEVVFFRHREVGETLQYKMEQAGVTCVLIQGGMEPYAKDAEIARFVGGRAKVILINLSCAEGLNLQCAHRLNFFELPWTMKESIQAEDRIHRIGSTETCHITYTFGTDADEHIAKILKTKEKWYLTKGDDHGIF